MRRHERPYSCTFLGCSKGFGSKNDWKRHEITQHAQHFLEEQWLCQQLVELPYRRQVRQCTTTFTNRNNFCEHLRWQHGMKDADLIETKAKECHTHRIGHSHIWCRFCVRITKLEETGRQSVNARFDHIGQHFDRGRCISE